LIRLSKRFGLNLRTAIRAKVTKVSAEIGSHFLILNFDEFCLLRFANNLVSKNGDSEILSTDEEASSLSFFKSANSFCNSKEDLIFSSMYFFSLEPDHGFCVQYP